MTTFAQFDIRNRGMSTLSISTQNTNTTGTTISALSTISSSRSLGMIAEHTPIVNVNNNNNNNINNNNNNNINNKDNNNNNNNCGIRSILIEEYDEKYQPKNDPRELDPIAWVKIPVVDHRHVIRHGTVKLRMWEVPQFEVVKGYLFFIFIFL